MTNAAAAWATRRAGWRRRTSTATAPDPGRASPEAFDDAGRRDAGRSPRADRPWCARRQHPPVGDGYLVRHHRRRAQRALARFPGRGRRAARRGGAPEPRRQPARPRRQRRSAGPHATCCSISPAWRARPGSATTPTGPVPRRQPDVVRRVLDGTRPDHRVRMAACRADGQLRHRGRAFRPHREVPAGVGAGGPLHAGRHADRGVLEIGAVPGPGAVRRRTAGAPVRRPAAVAAVAAHAGRPEHAGTAPGPPLPGVAPGGRPRAVDGRGPRHRPGVARPALPHHAAGRRGRRRRSAGVARALLRRAAHRHRVRGDPGPVGAGAPAASCTRWSSRGGPGPSAASLPRAPRRQTPTASTC